MFNRVFHYFHHPFWGTPIFGNTHISYSHIANYYVFFWGGTSLQSPSNISMIHGYPILLERWILRSFPIYDYIPAPSSRGAVLKP